jgi:hypothetical protein
LARSAASSSIALLPAFAVRRRKSASTGAWAPAGGDIDCDQVAGPVRMPPGDPDGLDGDGDGWGCKQTEVRADLDQPYLGRILI